MGNDMEHAFSSMEQKRIFFCFLHKDSENWLHSNLGFYVSKKLLAFEKFSRAILRKDQVHTTFKRQTNIRNQVLKETI